MQIASWKFWGSLLASFLIGWTLSYFTFSKSIRIEDRLLVESSSSSSIQSASLEKSGDLSISSDVPAYVLETLEYIFEYNQAPHGYVGGRTFQNREGLLPKTDATGVSCKYREWDVHPKVASQNRGAERLVTSQKKEAYFTSDHYTSFIKINK